MKRKKFFTNVALATLFLFSGGMSVAQKDTTTANADENTVKTVHYFSDDPHAYTYEAYIETNNIADCEVWIDTYTNHIANLMGNETQTRKPYETIDADYVIFEISNDLEYAVDDTNSSTSIYTDSLETIFREWNENGIEVMFICGTEEVRFENHNDFLDYVDIHVNTDIFDIFTMSIFDQIYTDLEQDWYNGNFTLLLDANLGCPNASYTIVPFFKNYLIPLIRDAYKMDLYINPDVSSSDLLNNYGIQILSHVSGDTFYDFASGQTLDYSEIEPNEHIYSIGSSVECTRAYAQEWIDLNAEIQGYLSIDFPIYIYNASGYYLSEYSEESVYLSGSNTDILPIIVDFLEDDDLTVYNNWLGRCVITHKAIGMSEDGWMRCMYDSAYFFSFLRKIISQEDMEFYHGYDSEW